MRLLVCGNRDWTCVKTIDAWMRAVFFAAARAGHDEFVLIEGEAEGAYMHAAGEAMRSLGYVSKNSSAFNDGKQRKAWVKG
jgi:hypothetical protein